MARLGSGSACRSVYGSTVLWGFSHEIKNSSDEVSIPINEFVHPVFNTYNDAILVVDSTPKTLSSSEGHKRMKEHFYANVRYHQAKSNLHTLLAALKNGDIQQFARIVETEAMSLHGLLFSSNPPVLLIHPNSINIIKKINEYEASTKQGITYTLDAGPNVHLLYPEQVRSQLYDFIESELKPLCENGLWIDDTLSDGPQKQ